MLQTARQRLLYILSDFFSAGVAWFVFNLIRYFTLPYNYERMSMEEYFSMSTIYIGQIVFPLLMVILFAISGYYNKIFIKSRLDDVLNSCGVSLIGTILIFFIALFNDQIDDRLGNFETCLILWGLFSVFTILPRLAINSLTIKKIRNRKIAFNVLIHGTSPHALKIAEDLDTKYKNMGFKVVGFIRDKDDDNEQTVVEYDGEKHPIYDISELDSIIVPLDIQAFIIVPKKDNTSHTIGIINKLLPTGKSVYMTPDSYSFIAARPRTSMVAGQVLIDISNADISQSTVNLKRIGDIISSAIALIVLAPVCAAIAVAIKCDSKGPVIYKQERIGYKKKPFKIYKFRSMRTDAEANGPALSSANDTRITKVGHFLRKYRLDELPQFWNVFKGDMSLVGPRPEREYFFKQIVERAPYYTLVHQVRPGITSWGMVKYGYASTVDEMVQRMNYDLIYVENVSFAVDLKILFYTVNTVITGKGI